MKANCVTVFFVLFCVLIFSDTGASSNTTEQSKPDLLVHFDRQTIREDDSLLIEVLLSNSGDVDLTGTVLQINSPEFLLLHEVKSGNVENLPLPDNRLTIGTVTSHSLIRKIIQIKSPSVIQVGSFSLLFTVEFTNGNAHGVVSVEKSLQASLFGSDTIAGVPIALAGFIVPGLFFWVIISWFRVRWSVDVALGDKMIYSVLVSVILLIVGAWFNIGAMDVRKGIGVIKLVHLASSGVALGIIVGTSTRIYLIIIQHQKAKRQIRLAENPECIFRKLLLKNLDAKEEQFRIRLTNQDNDVYVGSLFDQSQDTLTEKGVTSVIGWCRISPDIVPQDKPAQWYQRSRMIGRIKKGSNREQIWQTMKEYYAKNKLVALYDLAKREGFKIEWDGVAHLKETEGLVYTKNIAMQWRNDEVSGAPEHQASQFKPLRLVG